MKEQKKPHISPSQISSYLRCPEAYRRRYVKGEKIPPGIALVRGSSVHKGAELNFKQKVDSHEDLKKETVIEYAAAQFDERTKDGIWLPPGTDEPERQIIGKGKDETVALTDLLMTAVAPTTQPKTVEEKQRIAMPGSHDLLGIIDLVDDKDTIVDFKTTARAKSQDDVDKDHQFTFYALTYRAKYGVDPSGIRIENLILKKKPEAVAMKTTRDKGDYQVLINRINAVVDSINKAVYPPAAEGAWCCSPKFCGYWSSCPYINNKKEKQNGV